MLKWQLAVLFLKAGLNLLQLFVSHQNNIFASRTASRQTRIDLLFVQRSRSVYLWLAVFECALCQRSDSLAPGKEVQLFSFLDLSIRQHLESIRSRLDGNLIARRKNLHFVGR